MNEFNTVGEETLLTGRPDGFFAKPLVMGRVERADAGFGPDALRAIPRLIDRRPR